MKPQASEKRRLGGAAPGAALKELAVFFTVIALTLLLSFAFIG
ncbi:hypothetical protein [Variovorax sp. UMC13]|jgi:hypothetical protein|nr:hypothetical protein [Variovorax sp. UMC13]